MATKAKNKVEFLELDYQLAELPSSQHRAGLAGLVLMTNWLKRKGNEQGICEITRLDELGATLRLDERGLQALFDELYAASWEENPESSQRKKSGTNEIIPPVRIEERESPDSQTGKIKKKTFYIYPIVVPRGAFLLDLDPSANGDKGIWVKLWRDMMWSILRGVPVTRKPFEARADKSHYDDAAKTWRELCEPLTFTVDLPSTYYIGAQAFNAENVPFKDRARYQFLLHFWPYVAQIYKPAMIDNEGERKFIGYALAVPDVADLKWFCDELIQVLRFSRSTDVAGYVPREAVVDLAVESALDVLRRLHERLAKQAGGHATSELVLGIDVIHVEKQGNSIKLLGTARVDPEAAMIDEYAAIHDSFKNHLFRRQRLINLMARRAWYVGFERLLCRLPYKQSIGSKTFRRDVRQTFEVELKSRTEEQKQMVEEAMASSDVPPTGASSAPADNTESLVYRLVGNYIARKLKSKYQLEWASAKNNPTQKAKYEEMKEKVARDAFLAARSRTGADFADYFASTLCSVPQFMSEQDFAALAQALYQEPDRIRTLTMLALSARA